ncbi:hypothetical protein BDN72DRAFT_961184 [Pluteus cervinus]|uniref:Uncharacterized protein n=1 Tax=Pluteus cervinus TaxID=181527 RepID=A0ACD3ANW9_9AGAR|nr:hypothetical protein BDN72DRAFT_961184 [Pluteus cervinus]
MLLGFGQGTPATNPHRLSLSDCLSSQLEMNAKTLLSLATTSLFLTCASAAATLQYIPSPEGQQMQGPHKNSTIISLSAIGVNDAGATTYAEAYVITEGPPGPSSNQAKPTTIQYTWVEDATHYVHDVVIPTVIGTVEEYEECDWNSNGVGSCEAGAALYEGLTVSSFASGFTAVPDASTARTWTGNVQPWLTIKDIVYTGGAPDSGVTPSPAPSNNPPSWGAKSGSAEKARGSTVFFLVGSVVVMYLVV